MLPETPSLFAQPRPAAGDVLTTAATLVRDRHAEPRNVAQLLLAHGPWDPSRGPLAVASRLADVARASLPLACAMTHHARGLLMMTTGRASTDPCETAWDLTDADVLARPGPGWTVTGEAVTCCPPPDRDVRFVVLSRHHGHVMSVPAAVVSHDGQQTRAADSSEDSTPSTIGVVTKPGGSATVSFREAAARVHGPYSEELLARAAVISDLLEAAAWYGALTRIADGLVAADGDDWSGDRIPDLALAEADALLGATWVAIREGAGLWERGSNGTTATHHTARARTLTRTAAATLLAGYVPDEYAHARRDPGSAEAREQLVAWMGRRPWASDIEVVAATLRREGPSW